MEPTSCQYINKQTTGSTSTEKICFSGAGRKKTIKAHTGPIHSRETHTFLTVALWIGPEYQHAEAMVLTPEPARSQQLEVM